MKKISLLFVMLLLSMTILTAQTIAEYTFNTTTDGTLEDMTGSSNFTNLTPGSYYDDTASAVTNIGFTFGFGLGAYTQFSVNSNGQMQLGATAISGGSASPASNLSRLAPLSGDNAIRATGKVHYKVTGSAPNRRLVVEWLDLRVPYSSSAETGTYCRMQAWLYEGNNNIKFVYGTMWNMSTSSSARGVYVSTSNVAGTVGNVETITATPTWTTTGTSVVTTSFPASSAMANLNSAADGSRRVFHINYPVYTTPPNAAILLSPANGGWAVNGDALTWQSGGGGATSYDVYFGTTNPPAFVQNQGASSYTPTLVGGNTYYWNVVARNAFGAASPSATWSFRAPTATQVYESFESTSFPPAGWANGTTGNWTRSTSYYKYGTASAYKSGSTSTQYILSTPRVTITGTSAFNLWTLCSTTTGTLQIVYSPDRTTWTQIGSNITHAATYTWYNTNVDLSSLAGNNYYLGVRTGLQSASFYTDMYIGPEITPEAPGAPGLSVPVNLATGVNEYTSFTWTTPSTGGVPTGYKLYVDTVNPPVMQVADINALTYTLTTPLAYETTYYWSVAAYNGAGTGPQATVRSFTTRANPVVATFPWTVDFSTYLPNNWAQYNYLYGGTPATGGSWLQDDWLNITNPVNKAAKINIYTSSQNSWLVTPPLQIPAAGYELKFDLALMVWNSLSTPVTAGNQGDDRFLVVISNNPNMTDPTTLMEWNNTGSANVFDNISPTGSTYTIDLDGYVGTKYIGFYAESILDNTGDNDLMVDNVIVRETPSLPVMSLLPNVTEVNFGLIPVNNTATQQFTVTNIGGGTLTFNPSITAGSAYYSISVPPGSTSLTAGQFTTFTVQYLPTAEGGPFTGTLTISDNRTVTTISLSGSAYAPASLPFTETWESGLGNWQIVNGTQTNKWYIGSVVAHNGSNSAFVSNDSGVSNAFTNTATSVVHMYQDVAFTSGNYEFNLSFWHKGQGESTYDGLKVYVVDTSVTPVAGTQLSTGQIGAAWYNLVADWTNIVIPLSNSYAGTTKRLVFTWVNDSSLGAQPPTALDDIELTAYELAAPDPVTLLYPTDDLTYLPKSGFNLSWTRSATGSAPTSYIVHMGSSAETVYTEGYDWEITTTQFNPVTAATNPIVFNYNDIWYWTVEAVNSVGSTVVEPPFSFQIEPDPAIASLPYSQNFDLIPTPNLPSGWTAYKGNSGQSLVTSNTYSHTNTNSVYMYNSSYTSVPLRLISPQILVPVNSIRFSFWVRAGGTGYPLQIGTVNALDGTGVFTEVASITPSSSTAFVQYVVSFAAYSGTDQYICIQHGQGGTYRSFYLDSFLFEQLLSTDIAALSIAGDTYGLVGESFSYDVTVKNNGTATQNTYTVNLRSEDTRVLLASLPVTTPLAPDATAVHAILWTPSEAGSYDVYGEVVVDGDGNNANNYTSALAVGVFAADSFIPQIGNINSTTTTNMYPIDMYYKNNLCETIYLPHELQMSSGTINAIVFQNNFTQDLTKPLKIWMKHTTESSLPTDFLAFTGYTLVFEGNVHFPLGVNSIVIPLSTPFAYTGGNLAVRTYRVWENQWWITSNVFYYTASPEYPNRTRYMYVDGDGPYDPETLTPFTGSVPTYGTVNNIPNTAFIAYPAVPFAALGTPTVSISHVGANVQLDWAAVPNAYSYKIYASDDPYSWIGDPIATVRANTYSTASSSKKFYKVVAQTTYRFGDESLGLNPAAIIGFDNSKVKALPLIPNTENK